MEDKKIASVTEVIRKSLGLETMPKSDLNESYVSQPKSYDLPTEFLSSKAKSAHLDKYNHASQTLTRISANLDSVDLESSSADQSAFRSLKLDETNSLNEVYLHEMYFANISDLHSEITMDSIPYMRLSRDFGTFDSWQNTFIAAALSSRGGWAITAFNTFLQKYTVFFTDGDSCFIPMGSYPVIVLDMAEHAYYRDYQNDKKTYVRAMMKELDWDLIEDRFKRSEAIAKVLR